MKKVILVIIGLALAFPAWAAQTAVTQISGTQASVGALKTQTNAKLGTVELNRQDHETRVAAMETGKETKAVVQASAPADTTVDWYDTDQEPGVLVLKKHNGTTWVRASSHGVQYQSSCASITAGMCVDTDDGKLYYHNNTSVVEVGTGSSSYTLPTATADTLGGIKVGSRLTITDGVLSADVQSGTFDPAADIDFTGDVDFTGATVTGLSGGSMVYPSAVGVAVYGGSSAWGSSLTVGTAANNLVQLNGSGQLPAVSAALLTNFPILNQNTTGTAGGLSAQYIDWSSSSGGSSIANKPTLGTAAALDYGTDAGDLVRLVDDEGTPALPFSISYNDLADKPTIPADVGDLTDTGGLLGGSVDSLDDLSDVTLGTPSSGQVLKFNGSIWAPAADATAEGAGYVSTPPTYSDEVCTAGQYAFSTSTGYVCVSSGDWNTFSLTDWSNPKPVLPTLTSRSIGTDGTTLTLTGSASLSVGSGGNGGFDVDCTTAGDNIAATYSSGAPGSSLVYTLGSTINSGDTCDLDYTQPGDGIEATTGGADLASITSAAITNNSTQSASVSVTDNFDRANGALGSNWTATGTAGVFSDGSPVINSNVIVGPSYGTVSAAYYSGATFASNQYASAETISASGGTAVRGPAVRLSAGPDGYYGTCYIVAGTDTRCQLYRIDDGALTQLGSNWEQGGTANLLPNKAVKVEANGSTIKLYLNGAERLSVTDATYTGGYPGIRVESTSTTENMDNFAAGDL